jgi:Phage capsid family
MPIVKPKMTRAEEAEAFRRAAHEAAEGIAALAPGAPYRTQTEREIRGAALIRAGLGGDFPKNLELTAYEPGSPHSYFRDMAVVAAAAQQVEWMPARSWGSPGEAQARLATVSAPIERARYEARTLSTTTTAGGDFVSPGPAFLAEQFATAVRAASKMTSILPRNPLPAKGIFSLSTPRITTGATTGVQATQNSAVSSLDLVEEKVANPVATISGFVDLSQQLLDHSDPGIDIVLAADLGKAYGQLTDQQILRGTGSNNQVLGLSAVTGITNDAYTDASATQAEGFAVMNKLYADVSTAVGDVADAILMHPRRMAWFTNWKDSSGAMQSNLKWPCAAYQVPAISTTDGGSTNSDEIYILRTSELPYYATDPVFAVAFDQVGSGTLTVRFRVHGYLPALFARRPEAIGRSTGTGWASPVFS